MGIHSSETTAMADLPHVPRSRATVHSATELIGNTPLIRLNKLPASLGLECDVYVKAEFFNAGGSVKDRIALRMIEQAEKSGRIKPGDTLIEPTSGNTGIGLALVGAIKGYKTIITLPEKMSAEKVSVLRALGATIIRTPTQAAWDSPESHIGVARGIRKHSKDVKIIAADPQGSILAVPESLNEEHMNAQYKVEGIGYDFIPDVLDRETVDKWYKTDDQESFFLARRLISEEGLLVGGSSGSAMAAMVSAVKDFGFKKGDVVVVILPDSIRSYLTKFADDDWLAANKLLPTNGIEATAKVQNGADPYEGATIASLRLKPVTSVSATATCSDAIETMRDKGFDQLPVLSATTPSKLVGLVTLGNLLSYISRGRATADSQVKDVMFDFAHLEEIITDPRQNAALGQKTGKDKKRKFVQITKETSLSELSKFFEWNSAAVVTEQSEDSSTLSKPIAIVTKVDLLSWMVNKKL